ncbi:hypothetical protein HDU67_008566, partial [Dinochytrium kinnereticum]
MQPPFLYCTALYDYAAVDETGLSFAKGQIIQVHNQLDTGWWDGVANGERGWFPSNYVSEPEELAETPSSFNSEATNPTWLRQVTPDGRVFYRNTLTNETSHESEDPAPGSSSDNLSTTSSPFLPTPLTTTTATTLPPNWTIFNADNGSIVYFNTVSKEIRWTPPVSTLGGGLASVVEVGLPPPLSNAVVPDGEGTDGLGIRLAASASASASAGGSNGSGERRLGSRGSMESLLSKREIVNEGLPKNWGRKTTVEGRVYFYNMLTNETVWDLNDISGEPDVEITLNNAAQTNSKHLFIPTSTAIVESIRVMLVMARPLPGDEEVGKMMRAHQRNVMGALTKLVGRARIAAGVWPPPDAVEGVREAAGEVLRRVRGFVGDAQGAGIEVGGGEVAMTGNGVSTTTTTTGGVNGKAEVPLVVPMEAIPVASSGGNRGFTPSTHPPSFEETVRPSLDMDGSMTSAATTLHRLSYAGRPSLDSRPSLDGRPSLDDDTSTLFEEVGGFRVGHRRVGSGGRSRSRSSSQRFRGGRGWVMPSHLELVGELERCTVGVVQRLGEVEVVLRKGGAVRGGGGEEGVEERGGGGGLPRHLSSQLITEIRQIVTEVGSFLTMVDDLPLATLKDDITVDFKVTRGVLYNAISSLVMAISNATSELAPADAVEEVLECCAGVERAVRELLVSTKFLVEEGEEVERRPADTSPLRHQSVGSDVGVASPLRHQSMGSDMTSSSSAAPSLNQEEEEGTPPQLKPPTRLPLSTGSIPTASSTSSSTSSFPNLAIIGDASTPSSSSSPSSRRSNTSASAVNNAKRNKKLQKIFGAGVAHPDGSPSTLPPPTSPSHHQPQDPTPPPTPTRSSLDTRTSLDTMHSTLTAAAPDTWYLKYDYAPTDIVLNMEGQVKGGRLDSLVERLTLHDAFDPAFLQTFLLTYRSFTTSNLLFRLLERRFVVAPPEGLGGEEFEEW